MYFRYKVYDKDNNELGRGLLARVTKMNLAYGIRRNAGITQRRGVAQLRPIEQSLTAIQLFDDKTGYGAIYTNWQMTMRATGELICRVIIDPVAQISNRYEGA